MILLIKLILAHLIGDFILQPNSWVTAKKQKKLKAYQLYLHVIIHGVLIMILVAKVSFIKWAILITILHLIIDAAKILLQKEATERNYFFIDQAMHLLSIVLVWHLFTGVGLQIYNFTSEQNILLFTAVVFITFPSSILIKQLIARWTPHTAEDNLPDHTQTASLKNAGKYIGILERLFVFIFIITSNWDAIGFLITAKSVFRFGDLKESKDRILTEYILIGTLISFGLAILTGLLYLKIIPFLST